MPKNAKIAQKCPKLPKMPKKGQKMPKKVKNAHSLFFIKTCNFIFNYDTTLLQMQK